MKPTNLRTVISIILGFGLMLITCSKDDSSSNDTVKTTIETIVQSGTWKIELYEDSGNDETNHFSGYNFTFYINGVLNANNGIVNHDGTWSITDSNSSDDSQDDLDFNINFIVTNDFEDLNDDWDLISYSSIRIELIDVSGGSGETDYLTFEKN